jgi:hypothetical protein
MAISSAVHDSRRGLDGPRRTRYECSPGAAVLPLHHQEAEASADAVLDNGQKVQFDRDLSVDYAKGKG